MWRAPRWTRPSETTGAVLRTWACLTAITLIDADTGEIIRDLHLDPTRDYQPLGRPPGPPKGSPQRGGRKKKNNPQT